VEHSQHQNGGKRNAESDAQATEKVLAVDELPDFERIAHRLPDFDAYWYGRAPVTPA
jgi:hypothetical protein